jgi:hypothetical protein
MPSEVVQKVGSMVWKCLDVGGKVGWKAASLDELAPAPVVKT